MQRDDEDMIYPGDLCELVVQPRIWGMAIGFEGSLVHVRIFDGSRQMFHEFELRKMAGYDPDPEPAKEATPAKGNDNVVNFTRAKELRANTKTKGAA